jgi:hypothetical protein
MMCVGQSEQVSDSYNRANARDGIRELVFELGRAKDRPRPEKFLFYVLSLKWITLIATDCDPARTLLIRPLNENTIGYTTDMQCKDSTHDQRVGVYRTDDGQFYFADSGSYLAASEFITKLVRLIAVKQPQEQQQNQDC